MHLLYRGSSEEVDEHATMTDQGSVHLSRRVIRVFLQVSCSRSDEDPGAQVPATLAHFLRDEIAVRYATRIKVPTVVSGQSTSMHDANFLECSMLFQKF